MRSFLKAALLGAAGSLLLFAGASAQDDTPLGLKKVAWPEDNKHTAEKVALGKQLYFDKRLSKDDTISCASCHDPKKGWSNGEAFATGVRGQKGGRSSPTIINSAYQAVSYTHLTLPTSDLV